MPILFYYIGFSICLAQQKANRSPKLKKKKIINNENKTENKKREH